jgi:hypothetical protein
MFLQRRKFNDLAWIKRRFRHGLDYCFQQTMNNIKVLKTLFALTKKKGIANAIPLKLNTDKLEICT